MRPIAPRTGALSVGDKLIFTNSDGVSFYGVRTITGTEVWAGSTEKRYFYTPTDSPWFSVPASCLRRICDTPEQDNG